MNIKLSIYRHYRTGKSRIVKRLWVSTIECTPSEFYRLMTAYGFDAASSEALRLYLINESAGAASEIRTKYVTVNASLIPGSGYIPKSERKTIYCMD